MPFWTHVLPRSWKWPSLPDRARRSLPLLFGILLSGGSLYMAASRIETLKGRIEAGVAPTEVVVAASGIAAGDTLGEGNLARRAIPSAAVGKRHVPAGDFHLLLGGRAREAVPAGEPILWSDVADPLDAPLSEAVPPGKRAVTLPVESTSTFGGLLRPGDTVDLLCTSSGDGGPTVLLERVPVLAVGKEVAGAATGPCPEGPQEGASTATLSLPLRESTALLSAARQGSVQWMLRNGTDNGTRPRHADARPRPVELWEGGLPCARRSSS